jgi:hypothetical protein
MAVVVPLVLEKELHLQQQHHSVDALLAVAEHAAAAVLNARQLVVPMLTFQASGAAQLHMAPSFPNTVVRNQHVVVPSLLEMSVGTCAERTSTETFSMTQKTLTPNHVLDGPSTRATTSVLVRHL